MKDIKGLLKKLDSILKEYNLPSYKRMYPPLTEDKIDEVLKSLNLNEPDLKSFYMWKNGADVDEPESERFSIFPMGNMVSLEYILEAVKINIDAWEPFFVPLIASGDGDFILYNNSQGEDQGRLHLFSAALLSIENPLSCYDSIYTMIETTIQGYKEGIMAFDAKGNLLNVNQQEYFKMARLINKKSEYWNS